jgi:hypothetical protein
MDSTNTFGNIASIVFAAAVLSMHTPPGITEPERVSRLVREQAAVDLALVGQQTRFSFQLAVSDVSNQLEKLGARASVHAWRVSLATDPHWHSYVVARVFDEYYVLGGFQSPQVREFSRALANIAPKSRLQARMRILATLLDDSDAPNGIGDVADFRIEMDTLWAKWDTLVIGWPRDTVVSMPDGMGFLARTTNLSLVLGSSAFWQGRGFSFLFDSTGTVGHWGVRNGPTMPLR